MKSGQVLIRYSIIALVAMLALFMSMFPMLQITSTPLLIDCMLSGIALSGLIYLFMFILKYGHFSSLVWSKRAYVFGVLLVLFVLSWLIISMAMTYLSVTLDEWNLLLSTVPMRIVFAIIIYSVVILWANNLLHFENEPINDRFSDNGGEPEQEQDVESEQKPIVDIDQLVEEESEQIEHVAVKNGQKIDIIPIAEIIHLQAEGDYVMIHSTKGRFLKEQTMKSFELQLPSNRFVRVHRSNIINIDYIAQIELYEKQSQIIKLKNGTQVKISSNGYKQLKKVLGL